MLGNIFASLCCVMFCFSLNAGRWKVELEIRTNNSHDEVREEFWVYQIFQHSEGGVSVSFEKESDGLIAELALNCDVKGAKKEKIPILAEGEEYKIELPFENKNGCYAKATLSYND